MLRQRRASFGINEIVVHYQQRFAGCKKKQFLGLEMKLAAIYNFFNGEEHLISSLRSIRKNCSYVCVVAQRTSNIGQSITQDAIDCLEQASAQGLVDDVIWFQPDLGVTARKNELQKRSIGLARARQKKCSHFFSMDADEFYRGPELEFAKTFIQENNLNSTSVSSFFHVKRPKFRFSDTTNVAFITKIGFFTKLGAGSYPIGNIDSTRKVRQYYRRHHHFDASDIAMYHMNLVRKNLGSKLANTSTTDRNFLDAVRASTEAYAGQDTFNFPNKGDFTVINAENEFNTFDPERADQIV